MSRGIGFPSAVDGTSDVEDLLLLGLKKSGGKEKGRECRLESTEECLIETTGGSGGGEVTDEIAGGSEGPRREEPEAEMEEAGAW